MARKLRRAKDPLEYKATPMKGASKRQIDLALGAIKLGSSVVSLMSGLLAAVLILYSSYVLYDTFSTSYGAYKSSWDLLQYKPEIVDDGATPSDGRDTLASINKDYRGWLTVYDTGIDYPVVQGENDLYYASHDVYGNVSLTGAIYLAAGNTRNGSDSYNLIYGHHMDNGAMFGRLDSFQTQSYFNEHRQGIWVTESGVYDLYAFALVTTDAYENEIYSVGNRAAQVRAFLEGDRSKDNPQNTHVVYYDRETARTADRILALSTCMDAETNGRLVLFLKMTRRTLPAVNPVTLTVRYVYADGKEAFETRSFVYEAGSEYRVESPRKKGYAASLEVAEGSIWEDTTITVVYKKLVTLTILYEYEDGTRAYETYTKEMVEGDHYSVTSPVIPDCKVSEAVVRGRIEEDTTLKVIYRKPHTLTIRYEYLDGTLAAETYTVTLYAGDEYSRDNPVIKGFTTAWVRVAGVMETRDVEVTVLYIPDEIAALGATISIDEYEIPLGLDNLHAQMGVCTE